MASLGGIHLLVPVIIMAPVSGLLSSLVTTCVSILVLAALFARCIGLGANEVLDTTAAYATVPVVFSGRISHRIQHDMAWSESLLVATGKDGEHRCPRPPAWSCPRRPLPHRLLHPVHFSSEPCLMRYVRQHTYSSRRSNESVVHSIGTFSTPASLAVEGISRWQGSTKLSSLRTWNLRILESLGESSGVTK